MKLMVILKLGVRLDINDDDVHWQNIHYIDISFVTLKYPPLLSGELEAEPEYNDLPPYSSCRY